MKENHIEKQKKKEKKGRTDKSIAVSGWVFYSLT